MNRHKLRTTYSELLETVQALMTSNQVVSGGFRYTRPAPSIYEQQWLWDSCFHAIIYCHIDPEIAKDELLSLLYHRGVDTGGMIPHMIYWSGGGQELWGREYTSTITQPPLLAHAVWRVFEATGDVAFLNTAYEPMKKHYYWLLENRDTDDDFLVSIIHPWESGWDASQRWDKLLGFNAPTDFQLKQFRHDLALKMKLSDNEISPSDSPGGFQVEPVDFNAIFVANLNMLARIADKLGHDGDSIEIRTLADNVKRAVREKMWDDDKGYFWDLAGEDETMLTIPTLASAITLYGQIPSQEQAARIVQHLKEQFSSTFLFPTTAIDNSTYAPDRYWRGNVWLNVNWLIFEGLKLYGYDDLAKQIAESSIELIEKSGFREYFDPMTGEGLGSTSHSWSGIVLDMVEKPNSGSATLRE